MKNLFVHKAIVLLSFVFCIYVNYISNAWPLNGFTAGALSDLYPNQFTPAGFTFAVWGVIYLSASIALTLMIISKTDETKTKWYYQFTVINTLNAAWLFAWHYQKLPISVMIMVILLIMLISLYTSVRENATHSNARRGLAIMSSFYLSWISVALVANITTLLVKYQFLTGNTQIESLIAGLLLTVALVICFWLTRVYKDFLHPLVLAWASFGVYSKATSFSVNDNTPIVITAQIVI
ncbi:MAG TPA: tryptophan-rich sensory protein, partial [Saprospiraceae bacterium]|nr:tryptophan-rich sensory protein [Saprospiraceae bacterium]